ncbi:unnamed protein product, partial [Prorocentrum cordatum]
AAAALAGAAAPPAAAGLGGAGPAEVLGHLWDALPAGSVRAQLEEWAGLAATRAGARKSAGGAQLLELRLLEGLLVRLADSHRDFGATVGRSLQLSRLLWAGVHSRSRAAWAREAREARGRPPLDASVEPVHIAMVASVGKPVFGRKALIGVRSALFFARSRPLRFHLLVDEEGEEDMRRALGTLEPWLRSRGQFRLYRAEAQEHVWRRVRAMFPADCLNFKAREGSHHYGSPGFLRLFPHEIVREPGARVVVWVDAGDFAFMSDPADLLVHHSAFGPEQMVAAPVLRELPFQIFDLPRLRRANWTQMVAVAAAEGYAERGPDLCFYGEGRLFSAVDAWPSTGTICPAGGPSSPGRSGSPSSGSSTSGRGGASARRRCGCGGPSLACATSPTSGSPAPTGRRCSSSTPSSGRQQTPIWRPPRSSPSITTRCLLLTARSRTGRAKS